MSKTMRIAVVVLLPVVVALAIGFFYVIFHLNYLQHYIDWDQFAYLRNIRESLLGGYIIFNAHHLHFEYGGELFHRWMVDRFGAAGFTDLVFNLRLRSLLTAAIGIVFLILFIKEAASRLSWAVLGGLAAAFTHGYLAYATKIDTGIFPAAAFCVILWILGRITRAGKGTTWLAFILGGLCALGVLMHQYIAFFSFIVCGVLLLPPQLFKKETGIEAFSFHNPQVAPPLLERTGAGRLKTFFIAAVTGLIMVSAAYFTAGKSYYNLSFGPEATPAASRGLWNNVIFQKWLFSYATVDREKYNWGKGLVSFYPQYPLRGYTDAFLSQRTLADYSNQGVFDYNLADFCKPESFVYNCLAVFTLVVLAGSLLFFPALTRRYGRIMPALAAALVVYAIFFTYWEPFYFEFWIIPAIIIIVLGVLLFNLLGEKISLVIGRAGQFPLSAIFAVFISLTALHNLVHYQIPISHEQIITGGKQFRNLSPLVFNEITSAPYMKNPPPVAAFDDPQSDAPSLSDEENEP